LAAASANISLQVDVNGGLANASTVISEQFYKAVNLSKSLADTVSRQVAECFKPTPEFDKLFPVKNLKSGETEYVRKAEMNTDSTIGYRIGVCIQGGVLEILYTIDVSALPPKMSLEVKHPTIPTFTTVLLERMQGFFVPGVGLSVPGAFGVGGFGLGLYISTAFEMVPASHLPKDALVLGVTSSKNDDTLLWYFRQKLGLSFKVKASDWLRSLNAEYPDPPLHLLTAHTPILLDEGMHSFYSRLFQQQLELKQKREGTVFIEVEGSGLSTQIDSKQQPAKDFGVSSFVDRLLLPTPQFVKDYPVDNDLKDILQEGKYDNVRISRIKVDSIFGVKIGICMNQQVLEMKYTIDTSSFPPKFVAEMKHPLIPTFKTTIFPGMDGFTVPGLSLGLPLGLGGLGVYITTKFDLSHQRPEKSILLDDEISDETAKGVLRRYYLIQTLGLVLKASISPLGLASFRADYPNPPLALVTVAIPVLTDTAGDLEEVMRSFSKSLDLPQ